MKKLAVLFSVLFVCFSPSYLWASAIPDTGQTTCYNASGSVITCPDSGQSLAQDGSYSIHTPSYTDNGDDTITDNNTGLMWQKQTGSTNYNWYKASGTYHATYNPSTQNVCGSLSLGEYSDWRLPSKNELMGILDHGIYPGYSVNTTYFPTSWTHHWSTTTYPSQTANAFSINFSGGSINYNAKTGTARVRCVRGEESTQNLADNGDGTVTDSATGLMWQQGESSTMNWGSALSYCESSTSGDYEDWRLPTAKELVSLTDDSVYNPATNTSFFPSAYAANYRSSTTVSSMPAAAWYVSFNDGCAYGAGKTGSYYARCVRNVSCSLAIAIDPENSGTVDLSPDGGNYYLGTEVTLTATPEDGWAFVYWDDGTTILYDNPLTVTMDDSKSLTAKFFRTFECTEGNFQKNIDDDGGQCVAYVRYETGIQIYGDAYTWYQTAINDGFYTSSQPLLSSIIVFGIQESMPNGHVGIVTDVDGDNVTIRDSNWHLDEKVDERTVDVSSFNVLGYIYCTP